MKTAVGLFFVCHFFSSLFFFHILAHLSVKKKKKSGPGLDSMHWLLFGFWGVLVALKKK